MPAAHPRHDRIDALRAVAMLWMTVFHFCYDLDYFGYWRQSFLSDPFWTWQRTSIVSLFLFCAGLGQAVAVYQGQGWPRFWRRWVQVVAAAALVSLGSWLMFPRTFIYFGVLHGIALMLVAARLTAHWNKRLLIVLGAAAMALPWAAPAVLGTGPLADAFNSRVLNWLGFVTKKPVTEDYVPLLPWLGVVWWGLAAGGWLLQRHRAWLTAPVAAARWIAPLGRISLRYYLLHQPVLIGGLVAYGWLVRQLGTGG